MAERITTHDIVVAVQGTDTRLTTHDIVVAVQDHNLRMTTHSIVVAIQPTPAGGVGPWDIIPI